MQQPSIFLFLEQTTQTHTLHTATPPPTVARVVRTVLLGAVVGSLETVMVSFSRGVTATVPRVVRTIFLLTEVVVIDTVGVSSAHEQVSKLKRRKNGPF